MKEIESLKDLYPADFIIKWRLTKMCNARCSYCAQWRSNDIKGITEEKLKEAEKTLSIAGEKISRMLERINAQNVQLDLIGGEVTIFNLPKILESVHSDKIKKIHITTNFLRDSEYYKKLAEYVKSRNIKISLCASFHYEMQSFEKYFEKVLEVKDLFFLFTCEMVSNENNQELCRKFVEKCERENLSFMIDADTNIKKSDLRENKVFVAKSENKPPRYLLTFTDGTQRYYNSRSEFMMSDDIKNIALKKIMITEGFMCTHSTKFVYIEYDKAVGRTDNSDTCINRMDIDDFKQIEPRPCPVHGCTLCGHMDLWRIRK